MSNISLQNSTRAASPPESTSVRFRAFIFLKEHLAQQAAEFFIGDAGIELAEPVHDGDTRLNQRSWS